MSKGAWIETFPGNFVWSNAGLVTKGMAPYGAVALGEIDEVCERLRAAPGASPMRGARNGARMGARSRRWASAPRPRATG